jgi:hypothetical protein
MVIKKIKNNTGGLKTYVGQEILAGEYYTISPFELPRWILEASTTGSSLEVDIASGAALVNDGTSDFLVPAEGLEYLQALDAGCIRTVIVDDSNKSADKQYMKYNPDTNKVVYVNPFNEIAVDYAGDLLVDADGEIITIDEET